MHTLCIIKFVDIEVYDLNPTVSPEPILSALKQWDRDQDLPLNIQFLSTGCEGAQAWLQLSYNDELSNNQRTQRRIWPKQTLKSFYAVSSKAFRLDFKYRIWVLPKSQWQLWIYSVKYAAEEEVSWISWLLWWTLGCVILYSLRDCCQSKNYTAQFIFFGRYQISSFSNWNVVS